MAEASLSRLALRSLAGGFAIGAIGLLAIGRSDAQALGGHDSNAPVSYAADRIELQDRQDRVVLAGKVSGVPEYLAASHLFCLPSLWEGFPNALAEAMATGLPAVAYRNCAGASDLLQHERTGLLAGEGDGLEQSLAEHAGIVQALLDRNAELAAQRMATHFANGLQAAA